MKCSVCRGACCEEFSLDLVMQPPSKDAQRWIELHAINIKDERLRFECRCTELTLEGDCAIWEDRPMVCELFIAGGPQCLEVVGRRRTTDQYQMIRDNDDPLVLDGQSV